MYSKKEVLTCHIVYGWGARNNHSEMVREGKYPPSRDTVRKLLDKYGAALDSGGKEAAEEYFRTKDAFNTPVREHYKLDALARAYIGSCIRENECKKQESNRKQSIDMHNVWDILRHDMGYDICYSTVTAYARDYRAALAGGAAKVHECFVRQWRPAGEECQFGWGEVRLVIGGRRMKLRMAAFALPHSNHRRLCLFIREHTLAFHEARRDCFRDIAHVPRHMVYDKTLVSTIRPLVGTIRLKVAVKSFVGSEKQPTDPLLEPSAFYKLEFRFCNARRGNEKATVEILHAGGDSHAAARWRSHRAQGRGATPDGSADEDDSRKAHELWSSPVARTYRRHSSRLTHEHRLGAVRGRLEEIAAQAVAEGWDYRRFLCYLLQAESEQRAENAQPKRLQTAAFPQYKYMEQLDLDQLPEGVKPLLNELKTLEFIRQGRNAVFYGNPRTGKTHLSIALGILACKQRMTVLFTSVPHLITQIKECRSQQTLHALETRFRRYDLIICDEFGYMACDKEGGELLFFHLSLRAGQKSAIITTSLSFDRWGEVIKDKILVNALVDRLTHKAYLINMNGESYRLKETRNFNQKLQKEYGEKK